MATYYVSTLGNDEWNGGPATPFATPQKAANVMVAGDICDILGATYGSSGNGQRIITQANGTANAPITFQAYQGQSVTIFSSGLYSNIAINHSYINIIGLNCIGDANSFAGVDIERVIISNITIQKCSFSNFQVGGIYMDETATTSNINLISCTINGTNTASNMEAVSFRNVNGFLIESCLVENTVGTHRCGICTAGCTNGTIQVNIVYNTSSYGIYVGPSVQIADANINVFANLVYGCQNAGLAWADEVGYGYTSLGIVFDCNIVHDCYRGFELDQPDEGTGGTFHVSFQLINNDFYNNGGSAGQDIFITALHTQLTNCIIRNNIIYDLSAGQYALAYSDYANGGITIDHNCFYNSGGNWNSGSVFGTNYIQANPLFVSPGTDFTLQSGSPCIGAASSIGAPTTDYAGNPWTGCIGAYQYQSGSFTHGTVHTASLAITENPPGISCQVQIKVGTALSSKVSFTSGTNIQVSVPITMPAAGTYSVYIDIYMEGVLIQTGIDSTQVTVV